MTDVDVPIRREVLPGALVIRRIRGLLLTAALSGVAVSSLISGSRGACVDAVDGAQSTCVTVQLRGGGLLPVIFAVIVLWAITRVLNHYDQEADASRFLDRTGAAIIVVALLGIVASYVWFFAMPLPQDPHSYTIVSPFPFATIDVDFSTLGSTSQ